VSHRDNGEVALKLVRIPLAGEEEFLRRFEREARSGAAIEHRHLVRVLDTGEHDGRPYLTQELVPGGSLAERIRGDGPLPLDSVVRLSLEVGGALDALHAAGLIHRDLKPPNILLDHDGSAKVTDFGLVKDLKASVLTKMGAQTGTWDYMAPEQVRSGEVSAATDVYALGCVAYECLAGRPPFGDRPGRMQVAWAQLRDQPSDPCAGRDDVPEPVGWSVLQALAKEPAQRPPSATAFARMLKLAAGAPPPSHS
jgi:serine/threonine-protein kinase